MLIGVCISYIIYAHINLKEQVEEKGYRLLSFRDLVHIPVIIICRCIMVAVKYGFYSPEHMIIFKSIPLPKEFDGADKIGETIKTKNTDNIRSRILIAVKQLGIEPSSFVLTCPVQ
jgi:hypothetical protein